MIEKITMAYDCRKFEVGGSLAGWRPRKTCKKRSGSRKSAKQGAC